MSQPEAWLQGKIEGIPDALMPAAHALEQARIELIAMQDDVTDEECRLKPGGAASIYFHVMHIAGSLDRLFTYARGEQLTKDQFDFLRKEKDAPLDLSRDELFELTLDRIEESLDVLRNTPESTLFESRDVGRGKLPSNVIGLLFHAGEHTTMHVGQIRTTLKVIRGKRSHGS